MTKVRCSMVISPNGYISKPDGNEDWIDEINWDDFVADVEKSNNFIVGRTTYDVVLELDDVKAEHKVVVSSGELKLREGYVLVKTPQEAIDYLNKQAVEEILLIGGGEINASFAKAGLIDELELIIVPYVIGKGKQVLAAGDYEFPLELASTEKLSEGRVKLLYRVIKTPIV